MSELQVTAAAAIVKKAVDLFGDRIARYLSGSEAKIVTSDSSITHALSAHNEGIRAWAEETSFQGMLGRKKTTELYVPLNLLLSEKRRKMSPDEPDRTRSMDDLFSNDISHSIIYGQPGAGKSTSVKHLCTRFLNDSNFLSLFQQIILIRLRDLNFVAYGEDRFPNLIVGKIAEIAGLRFSYPSEVNALPDDLLQLLRLSLDQALTVSWLNERRALILLDGFDEITLRVKKLAVVEELRRLAPQLNASRIIITTRTGEFDYHVEGFDSFEVQSLSDPQIRQLATNWLGKEDANSLIDQIRKSPFQDTAIRPLTIAHLCAIYERSRRIPDKPKTVYRKVVSLLLDEWDDQRSLKRESAYSNFASDRKMEFLANLAYIFTSELHRTSFTRDDLKTAYLRICGNFGLPEKDAGKVAVEIESHTGLFLSAGQDLYEFSHKSLQEFLTAEYIVKLPSIPTDYLLLTSIPNELAIAVAISSRPGDYFSQLINDRLSEEELPYTFIKTFLKRLILERPDFEILNPVLSFAMLRLYSHYVLAVTAEKAPSAYAADDLTDDFSLLAESVQARLDLAELLNFYTIESEFLDRTNSKVLKLKRKRFGAKLSRYSHDLPKVLWVRSSLLSGSSRPFSPNLAEL